MFGLLDRHLAKTAPICEEFNAAVMSRANHWLPMGWKPCAYPLAPHDLVSLNAAVSTNVALPVYGFGPTMSVFGDEEHTTAFAAWFNALHWRYQLKFNTSGNAQVAYAMAYELFEEYGDDYTVLSWVTMILCMVIGGDVYAIQNNGERPVSREFIDKYGPTWKRLAASLAVHFHHGNKHTGFMALARSSWG